MNYNDFIASLESDFPPEKAAKELKALWWEASGNWEKAHKMVQNINGVNAARIHAYLHRKEGDLNNASFWYTLAGRPLSVDTFEEEWEMMVKSLLESDH